MSNATLQLGGGNFAVKDGKLLGYATDPKTSVFVSREFDFSRGSNLAATRVDANGLIEKGRENLLVQSNQFDTTWSSTATLTSGQEGHDGSNGAWLLTKTISGPQSVYQNINEIGIMTMSVYAKAGSTNWMRVTQGGKTAFFDLSTGTIGASSNGIDQTITSVGNGWYRCTLTANKTTVGQTPIYPYTAEGDASGSTDSIYIQDAQLEYGLVATDYIETGATTAQAGILEDMPRIDYTNSSSPALLLEPQRTNLVEYSEDFTTRGGLWQTFGNITKTLFAAISPDGYNTAAHIAGLNGDGTNDLRYAFSYDTANKTLTYSVYLKGSGTLRLQISNGIDQAFDEDITLTSDWQRHSVSGTFNSTSVAITYLVIDDLIGKTATEYYIWGAQLEEGSYPTSYIPTYGTAVTRSAPSLSKYDFTDSSTQTLFLEYDDTGYGSGGGELVIEKASPVAAIFRIYVHVSSLANDNVKVRFRTEFPVSEFNYDTNRSRSQNQKVAFVISGTTAKAFCNGSLLNTFTITETIMERLNFRVQNVKFRTKQLIMIPTALTDQEAIALTTL